MKEADGYKQNNPDQLTLIQSMEKRLAFIEALLELTVNKNKKHEHDGSGIFYDTKC